MTGSRLQFKSDLPPSSYCCSFICNFFTSVQTWREQNCLVPSSKITISCSRHRLCLIYYSPDNLNLLWTALHNTLDATSKTTQHEEILLPVQYSFVAQTLKVLAAMNFNQFYISLLLLHPLHNVPGEVPLTECPLFLPFKRKDSNLSQLHH